MIKKIISVFLISTFVFIPHKLSTLAQEECKDDICETTMDDLLYYPPDIPNLYNVPHEIGWQRPRRKKTGWQKAFSYVWSALPFKWIGDMYDTLIFDPIMMGIIGGKCEVALDKNSYNKLTEEMSFKNFFSFCDLSSSISSIMESNKTKKTKISDLNNLIDKEYEEYSKFKNEDSTFDDFAFCFHLFRINSYLQKFEEQDFTLASPEERKEVRKLRDKIDLLVPNYCCPYKMNSAPIAGVNIDRYNLLTDTKDVKRIYLKNYQVPKFVEDLMKSIDKKYADIKETYSLNVLGANEILELASRIGSTNYQDIINALATEAEEARVLCRNKALSIVKDVAGIGIKFATSEEGLFEILKEGSKHFVVSPEEARQYLKVKNPDLIKALPDPPIETAVAEQGSPSFQSLAKNVEELKLDKSQMSELELMLGRIAEYGCYDANAKRKENRVSAFSKQTELHKDYLNSCKLLLEFAKYKNYKNISNYDAIIIEEQKQYETSDATNMNLREYNVIDIKRMSEK